MNKLTRPSAQMLAGSRSSERRSALSPARSTAAVGYRTTITAQCA